MSHVFGFDVDGVLCDRGQNIDPHFSEWFVDWLKDKKYYIVTGSHREKTVSQIGEKILNDAVISFHCLSNNIWIKDHEVTINNFVFKDEELDFLNECIKRSKFPIKSGNHFEYRKGSVNFSIIGKNVSQIDRQKYVNYDNEFNERLHIVDEFTKLFPRFDAFIGGDVSIDICLTGANKKQIINLCNFGDYTFHYFGDRCFKYGADYPLTLALQQTKHICHQINNGYLETQQILKTL